MNYTSYREQLKKQLKLHEGVFYSVYDDPLGIPTVGVGFNLLREDAPVKLSLVGADYKKVLEGLQTLTPRQVEELLDICIKEAEETARKIFPDFDSYDDVRKRVIVDMIFNLGETRFRQFTSLIRNIKNRRFNLASLSMARSKWFMQTGCRAIRLTAMMLTGKDLID